MIQLCIAIVSAAFLFALGSSSFEIAIAFTVAFAFASGSTSMHRVIERRAHRKMAPASASYAAAFFGIGLGLAIPANFLLQESHFLVVTTAVFAAFILAEMIAHAFFGELIIGDHAE